MEKKSHTPTGKISFFLISEFLFTSVEKANILPGFKPTIHYFF